MKRLAISALLLSLFGTAMPEEQIVPSGYPLVRYLKLWENSPFNREVLRAKPTAAPVSAFGKNLTLEGLVNDEALGPIAYIRDLNSDQPMMVTNKLSAAIPYRIVTAKKDTDPQNTTVVISNGKERAEIGFASDLFTKTIQSPQGVPNPTRGIPGQPVTPEMLRPDLIPGNNPRNPQGIVSTTTPQKPSTPKTKAGAPPAQANAVNQSPVPNKATPPPRRPSIVLPSTSPPGQ